MEINILLTLLPWEQLGAAMALFENSPQKSPQI